MGETLSDFFLPFSPPVKFPLDVITFSLLTTPPSHTKYSPHRAAHSPCTFESLNVSFAFHSMFKIQELEMKWNHRRGPCNKWEIVISVLTPIMGIQPRKTTFIHPAQWETQAESPHQAPLLPDTQLPLSIRSFHVTGGHICSQCTLRWGLIAKQNLNLSVTVLDFTTVRITKTWGGGVLIQREPFLLVFKNRYMVFG